MSCIVSRDGKYNRARRRRHHHAQSPEGWTSTTSTWKRPESLASDCRLPLLSERADSETREEHSRLFFFCHSVRLWRPPFENR